MFLKLFSIISLIIGIIISDSEDEEDSNSIICLEQNVVHNMFIELDSENESIKDQEILKGLQERIEKQYMNSSQIYIHDTDHDHDHLHTKDEPFEFEYICEIPFGNQVAPQHSNHSILQSLPEVPVSQDKLLEDRIHHLLANDKLKQLSEDKIVDQLVHIKDQEFMSNRPLKKRPIKLY